MGSSDAVHCTNAMDGSHDLDGPVTEVLAHLADLAVTETSLVELLAQVEE